MLSLPATRHSAFGGSCVAVAVADVASSQAPLPGLVVSLLLFDVEVAINTADWFCSPQDGVRRWHKSIQFKWNISF